MIKVYQVVDRHGFVFGHVSAKNEKTAVAMVEAEGTKNFILIEI